MLCKRLIQFKTGSSSFTAGAQYKSSGIAVMDEVKQAYTTIKSGTKEKPKKANRYAIFKITDDLKAIVLDSESKEDDTFETFKEQMTKESGRYAVYDVPHATTDQTKIMFVCWVNDNAAKVKEKMLYSSSKSNCLKALEGQSKEIQINDECDFTLDAIQERAFQK